MVSRFGIFSIACWVLLLLGCSQPKDVPVLRLSELDHANRVVLRDRFDFLTQRDSLDQAQALVDSLEALNELPDWLAWSRFDLKGRLAELQGDFPQAIFEINQSLNFLEDKNAPDGMRIEAYFRRGDLLLQLRQYDLAFEDFFRGVGQGDLSMDACLNANFNYRLGMVSYRQSNFKEAIDYFKVANALFNSCSDNYSAMYRMQEVASNIGLCYWRLQQYDSSLVWYDSSLQIIRNLPVQSEADKVRFDLASWVSRGNKGVVLYENGSVSEGRRFMYESYEANLTSPYGDKGHGAFVGNALAAFLIKERKMKEAEAIIKRLDNTKILQPNSLALLAALRNKIDYFAAAGIQDSIWPHFVRYTHVADSIKVSDRNLIKLNTTLLLRGLDKDYALKAEKQKSEARLILNQAIGALLLLGISALIGLFVSLRRSRRQNKLLASLNEQVRDQNEVLESTFAQLKDANMELQFANEQQARILRVVAHDLRNPLAAMHSMSLMKLEEPVQEAEDLEFYRLAEKACRGGLDLINDLLESMESQQYDGRKPHFVRVQLHGFLNDTLHLVAHRAKDKDICLQLGWVDSEWEVELDVERFRRAVINLITNAIKFSKRGSSVQILAGVHAKGLQIEVIDQGIGIAEADLATLFESFTPSKRQGTEGEKAFGLGLSITRHILKMHQSEIEVESRAGEGSTFRIILPKLFTKTAQDIKHF
jgi:two-component system, OmpR family, sensor histidine kinase VicK